MKHRVFYTDARARRVLVPFSWLLALVLLCVAPTMARASGFVCHQTPPEVEVPLPLVDNVRLQKDSDELLSMGYSVSDSGLVHLSFQFRTQQTYLGVRTSRATEEMLPKGAEAHVGRRVTFVESDSAAEQAGIQVGDIIITFNGERISDRQRFGTLITTQDPAREVELEYYRNGERSKVALKLGTRAVNSERDKDLNIPTYEDMDHSGLVLGAVTKEVAAFFPAICRDGAVVLSLKRGSPAFHSRLRVGDVIVSLDDGVADSPRDMIEAIARAADEGQEVTLQIQRGEYAFETEFEPAENLHKTSDYHIPFVLDWDSSRERTDIALGPWGTLMGYQRQACFDQSGDADREWRFGMLLNLFELERKHDEMRLSFLWIIRFRW